MSNYSTIGVFADDPRLYTKSGIINSNLVHKLCRISDDIRTIYFSKNPQITGFETFGIPYDCYELVKCKNWKPNLLNKIAQYYKLDALYLYGEWFDAIDFLKMKTKLPLFLWTPINSLPIPKDANSIFRKCKTVFVPNRSSLEIPNGMFLPYTINWMIFKPVRQKMYEEFTFVSIGNNEPIKNIRATILAFEMVHKKHDCKLVMKSDWNSVRSRDLKNYISNQKLPIMMEVLEYTPARMAHFYSSFHAYVCSAKASESELEIIEAGACCLPSLATKWTFMDENIDDGKTGILVQIESKETVDGKEWGNISISELAKKMSWMLKNQKEAGKMGIDAFSAIRENSWEKTADKVFEIMEEKGL